MKILHVLYSPRAEGTPRIVLDWLSVPGFEQEILFLTGNGELRDTFEKTGVWQFYNTDFEPRFKSALQIAALVKRVCLERKPDTVIAWYLGFSHWIAWGARQAGVHRNIAHAGNPAGSSFMGKYVHSWISFSLGRWWGNIIIACSEYVMNSFKSIPGVLPTNIFSVYNCCRVDLFLPDLSRPIERNKDFIMVATMEPHKDQLTLLKAWQIVQPSLPGSKLFLVGDGSGYASLVEWSQSNKLIDVHFLGGRKDIPTLLTSCRFFVLSTTRQEGFGTVLIEAMAAGCKVIASDVPACNEVLKGGKYGKLVNPYDPEELAGVMREEYERPITAAEVEDQTTYARQFSPREMIRKYLLIADSYCV